MLFAVSSVWKALTIPLLVGAHHKFALETIISNQIEIAKIKYPQISNLYSSVVYNVGFKIDIRFVILGKRMT